MANWLIAQTTHVVGSNQTLHGGWPAVCSYTYHMSSKSVKWLRRCGVENGPSLLLWPVAYATYCRQMAKPGFEPRSSRCSSKYVTIQLQKLTSLMCYHGELIAVGQTVQAYMCRFARETGFLTSSHSIDSKSWQWLIGCLGHWVFLLTSHSSHMGLSLYLFKI